MNRPTVVLVTAVAFAAAAAPTFSMGKATNIRAIDARGFGGVGTFTYRDRNDVVLDLGAAGAAGESFGPLRYRDGQRFQRIRSAAIFEGKKGTFKIATVTENVASAGGWSVSTGTWSFAGGTGAYAGIRGHGRVAGIERDSRAFERFEGLVTGGPR